MLEVHRTELFQQPDKEVLNLDFQNVNELTATENTHNKKWGCIFTSILIFLTSHLETHGI